MAQDCFWYSMLNLVITCLFAVLIRVHGASSFKIHKYIFFEGIHWIGKDFLVHFFWCITRTCILYALLKQPLYSAHKILLNLVNEKWLRVNFYFIIFPCIFPFYVTHKGNLLLNCQHIQACQKFIIYVSECFMFNQLPNHFVR